MMIMIMKKATQPMAAARIQHWALTLAAYNYSIEYKPGAHFLKLLVITGPVKLFCFPFQMGVSKVLNIIQ